MVAFTSVLSVALLALPAFVSANCFSNCYYTGTSIYSSSCPGSSDPNNDITAAYLACECPTPNLANYLNCVQSCSPSAGGTTAAGIESFFNQACQPYGGVGPTQPSSSPHANTPRRRAQHKRRGMSIQELQARTPRASFNLNTHSKRFDLSDYTVDGTPKNQ